MRRISVFLSFLFTAVAAFGQIVSFPPVVYTVSSSAVDVHGNLLIFDTTYTIMLPPVGTTSDGPIDDGSSGTVIRTAMPKTRITVVPGGTGQPISKEYPATFQVIGTGKWSLYAAAMAYSTNNNQLVAGTRKLVAIDAGAAGTSLPADFSGFFNTDLTGGELKLNPSTGSGPDMIFNVDPSGYPIAIGFPVPVASTPPVKARIARTITFDGTRFTSTDITLTQ